MPKPKGNKKWGSHIPPEPKPDKPTAFEITAHQLQLKPKDYKTSGPLKSWAAKHYKSRFVPEKLLEHWGLVFIETDLWG
jgi:hypothetical protein